MFDRRVEDAQAQIDAEATQAMNREMIENDIALFIADHDPDEIDSLVSGIVGWLYVWNAPDYSTFNVWFMDICDRPEKESIEHAWACKAPMLLHARELAADYVDYLFEMGALK